MCGHYIKESGEAEIYTTGYKAKNQEPNTTTRTQALTEGIYLAKFYPYT
jgi:hypothetical protein